jgi:hypothetical protein
MVAIANLNFISPHGSFSEQLPGNLAGHGAPEAYHVSYTFEKYLTASIGFGVSQATGCFACYGDIPQIS